MENVYWLSFDLSFRNVKLYDVRGCRMRLFFIIHGDPVNPCETKTSAGVTVNVLICPYSEICHGRHKCNATSKCSTQFCHKEACRKFPQNGWMSMSMHTVGRAGFDLLPIPVSQRNYCSMQASIQTQIIVELTSFLTLLPGASSSRKSASQCTQVS